MEQNNWIVKAFVIGTTLHTKQSYNKFGMLVLKLIQFCAFVIFPNLNVCLFSIFI